jgi:hypothetical protein
LGTQILCVFVDDGSLELPNCGIGVYAEQISRGGFRPTKPRPVSGTLCAEYDVHPIVGNCHDLCHATQIVGPICPGLQDLIVFKARAEGMTAKRRKEIACGRRLSKLLPIPKRQDISRPTFCFRLDGFQFGKASTSPLPPAEPLDNILKFEEPLVLRRGFEALVEGNVGHANRDDCN